MARRRSNILTLAPFKQKGSRAFFLQKLLKKHLIFLLINLLVKTKRILWFLLYDTLIILVLFLVLAEKNVMLLVNYVKLSKPWPIVQETPFYMLTLVKARECFTNCLFMRRHGSIGLHEPRAPYKHKLRGWNKK